MPKFLAICSEIKVIDSLLLEVFALRPNGNAMDAPSGKRAREADKELIRRGCGGKYQARQNGDHGEFPGESHGRIL